MSTFNGKTIQHTKKCQHELSQKNLQNGLNTLCGLHFLFYYIREDDFFSIRDLEKFKHMSALLHTDLSYDSI